MVRKWYQKDKEKPSPQIESISIVLKQWDVFPNEMLTLPLNKEIKFEIDLAPKTQLIYIYMNQCIFIIFVFESLKVLIFILTSGMDC